MTAKAASESDPQASTAWPPYVRLALVVAVVLFGVALAAYALNGHYTRFWADDFCNAAQVRHRGLFGAQSYWYDNWTGRYSSVFVTDLGTWLGLGAVPYFALTFVAGWLAAMTLAFTQLCRLLLGRSQLLASLLLSEVVLFGFITSAPNRTQSVYWLSGVANYGVPLALVTCYAGLFAWSLQRGSAANRRPLIAASFLIALAGAGFAETYMAWQTALLAAVVAGCAFLLRGDLRRLMLPVSAAGLAGSLLGAAVVWVAPGNDVREQQTPPHRPVIESLLNALGDAGPAIFDFVTKPSILAVGVAALALAMLLASRRSEGMTPRGTALRVGVAAGLCFLLTVATYAPSYYILGNEPEERSMVSAELTIIATLAYFGYLAGVWLRRLSDERLGAGHRVVLAPVAALLILIGFATLPVTKVELDRREGLESYAAAWDARDAQLVAAKKAGEEAVVAPRLRHTGGLIELSSEATWFTNCMARFYGLKDVRAPSAPVR